MVEVAENRPSFVHDPDDWIGEQADLLYNQIQKIKDRSSRPDSSLSTE